MAIQPGDLHYLRKCLNDFPKICRKKYGEGFDLAAVEDQVRVLRRKTELTYSDLRFFESSEHWWFKRYWVFPPESNVAPALKGIKFDFWNLSEENEAGPKALSILIEEVLQLEKDLEKEVVKKRLPPPS